MSLVNHSVNATQHTSQAFPPESLTFDNRQQRDMYVRDQRMLGYLVILDFKAKDASGAELYNIHRSKL